MNIVFDNSLSRLNETYNIFQRVLYPLVNGILSFIVEPLWISVADLGGSTIFINWLTDVLGDLIYWMFEDMNFIEVCIGAGVSTFILIHVAKLFVGLIKN